LDKIITKSIEDYLKTIYILTRKKDFAKTSDISSALNVQPPSVTEMIQKLNKMGFVSYEKYKGITLTKKGEKLAKDVYKRNETLFNFLKIIGVKEKVAEDDACKMEHDLTPATTKHLAKFVEFVQSSPRNPKWLDHFKYYSKTGKHIECKEEVLK